MGCNINTTFTTNTIRVTMQAGGGSGSGTDELVKVSSNDIAAEYLEEKIIAGNNITITKNTDSNGIEILEVSQDEVDYIQYKTSPSLPTIVQGMRYWDSVNGTTSLYLGNDVTLQDGQELHIYGKAGENISNRDVIQFDAAQGDFIILKKAVPNEIRLNPYLLRGVATQSINDDNFGHVTWFGKVNNVYTTGWDVDDLLYYDYSGNGLMTNIAPTNGDPVILIGQVLKLATGAAENGVIIVFPPIVLITKLSDLSDDSTHRTVTDTEKSTWNGKQDALGFTPIGNISEDTTPQLGGDLDVNGKSTDWGAIISTNGTYKGDTLSVTVDTNGTGFSAVLAQGADFHFDLADADAVANCYMIAIALEAGTGTKKILTKGQVCNTSWNWSAGPVFLSTTDGGLTQTSPSGTDDVVMIVGWALSATVIFFDPYASYIEHT